MIITLDEIIKDYRKNRINLNKNEKAEIKTIIYKTIENLPSEFPITYNVIYSLIDIYVKEKLKK